MKKIINGKRYDTATASLVYETSNVGQVSRTDFKAYVERLYRTPRGKWFVHGEGGALTRWATKLQNGRTGGEGILPVDSDEAREWLEQHGDAEMIEQYFPVQDA